MNIFFSKKLFLSFILVIILGIIILFLNSNTNNNNHLVFHSTTMNVKVVDKYKEFQEGSSGEFYIKVNNLNSPYQEFYIKTKDNRLWNLIDINNTYFINVSWNTSNNNEEINNKTVKLLQIEELNSQ